MRPGEEDRHRPEQSGRGGLFSRPAARVGVLIALLGALTVWLSITSIGPERPITGTFDMPWWVLAIAFGAAEVLVVHLELKRSAHSISLAELPMVFGLFCVAPMWFVIARAIGSTVALVVHRRQRGVKLAFNVVNFTLEAVVAVAVFGAVAGRSDAIGPRAWLASLAATVTVNVVGVLSVVAVISLFEGKVHRALSSPILAAGTIGAIVNTVIAVFAVSSVTSDGKTGWLLLFLGTIMFLGYRGYAVLSQRHARLLRLYEFVRVVRRSPELDGSISEMLQHARDMMSADVAELFIEQIDSSAGVRTFALRGDDELSPAEHPMGEALWERIVQSGEGALIARTTKDPDERALLDRLGVPDLVVAPVRDADRVIGTLGVGGRLGDVSTFGPDDLGLLATLANHASTSLANGRLIDRLRAAVLENQHLAHHDPLTGLPNRVQFDQTVRRGLAAEPDRLVVMLMDLDRFKEVNDTLGHATGDKLLREVGARLAATLPGAPIARLGGDEFAVLCSNVGGESEALEIAHTLLQALNLPFRVGELTLEIGASIGIAMVPAHGTDPEALLRHADVAMYGVKAAGSGAAVYASELDKNTPRRLALVSDLRLAMERGDLQLHYQPKADVRTGRIIGVEALLRWKHPQHGPQSPDEFIPVAEQTGLIHELTLWVIRRALETCKAWARDGISLGMAVNLSARNLVDARLPDDIAAILEQTGVPASKLTLEITETAIMTDAARAQAVLTRLSATGVRLSVDDFGAGYSSLAYLKRLPVNEMKIDKSFVMNMASDGNDAAIVSYVVKLANSLGLVVVAEGVEDDRSWSALQRMGADVGQGYLLSPALPAPALVDWVRAREGHRREPGAPALHVV